MIYSDLNIRLSLYFIVIVSLQVHQSFWYKSPDLTEKINKEQLEMLFSVTDATTVPQSPAGKTKKRIYF